MHWARWYRRNPGAATPGQTNEKHGLWRGDKVGYTALHQWLYRHYGQPRKCEQCESETAKAYDWANITGVLGRDRENWMRLCRSCHMKLDGNGRGPKFRPSGLIYKTSPKFYELF